jgi:hypothetical protein
MHLLKRPLLEYNPNLSGKNDAVAEPAHDLPINLQFSSRIPMVDVGGSISFDDSIAEIT